MSVKKSLQTLESSKEREFVVGHKAGREQIQHLILNLKLLDFYVDPAGGHTCFDLVFSHYITIPPFRMVLHILGHFVVE